MRQLLLRPVIFVGIALGFLVLAELFALGGLTWMNNQRIHIIEEDIGRGHRLEETIFELLQLQLKWPMSETASPSQSSQVTDIQQQLVDILQSQNSQDFAVPADLHDLREAFSKPLLSDRGSLVEALELIRQILSKQTQEEEKLLIKIEDGSQLELQLAIVLPLVIFCLIFAIGRHFARKNVFAPLDALRELLSRLAQGEMQPIEQQSNDPLVNSLFDRYNHLVTRLAELEQEHLDYTFALEQKVRQTTHVLLEQSQKLARSERLAAVAELAASAAHELRNPLAGIQLALENMRQDCEEGDFAERLELICREVKGLTRNLNDLLATARKSAETSQRIDLHQVVDELITLLKYQVAENVALTYRVPSGLSAFLPETEFRQALLNLLLNAIQALDGGGSVHLEIELQTEQLHITVTDTGHGFSRQMLDQGIRPFVSLKEHGTGLGLAMVQRFVRDRHGSLQLQNDRHGHACVTLSLPIQPGQGAGARQIEQSGLFFALNP